MTRISCPCTSGRSWLLAVALLGTCAARIPFNVWFGKEGQELFSWPLAQKFIIEELAGPFIAFSFFAPVFIVLRSQFRCFSIAMEGVAVWQVLRFATYYLPFKFLPPGISYSLSLVQCTSAAGCSLWDDILFTRYNVNADQQLVEDAIWCEFVALAVIVIEGYRWSIPYVPAFVGLTIAAGYDLTMPVFIILLWDAEEQNGNKPRPTRNFQYLYLIMAVIAIWTWIPHFYGVLWEMVTHRYVAVPQNPFAFRSLCSVYNFAFVVGFYFTSDINPRYADGTSPNLFMLWVIRIAWIWLLCSNVAVACLVMLYYRESTPLKSFKSTHSAAAGVVSSDRKQD